MKSTRSRNARAIWQTYIAKHRTGRIELDELVGCSEHFSPADIAHAARQAAQRAFERAVEHGDETGTVTADYVTAIKATRPTMTAEMRREFDEDIDSHGRL
jgi:transitional endoplasmic reticulum ATPase